MGKMKSDLERWLEEVGERFLREVGIRNCQIVLDFGCGSGDYAIPAARIVGQKGRVYALDRDKGDLDKLMERAELEGLENIERMETSGELKIAMEDESVDAVLLYDIFWYFPLTDPRMPKLLEEVYRVTRSDALISVYPKHIDSEKLKNKIQSSGFRLKDKYSGTLIHQGRLETHQVVLNFVKSKRARYYN
jgi:ubiquinone/menaquinone biosynthesis C-methylase UbiE